MVRIELAKLGRLQRGSNLRILRDGWGGGGDPRNQGERGEEGEESDAWRHAPDYSEAEMNRFLPSSGRRNREDRFAGTKREAGHDPGLNMTYLNPIHELFTTRGPQR